MGFIAKVISSLMAKGLTRKEAKQVVRAHHPTGPRPRPEGMSRQVARKLIRADEKFRQRLKA